MSKYEGRDYIWVLWKDPVSSQRYIIGEISKNGEYEFKYRINQVDEARQKGFENLVAFPDLNKLYTNKELFPAFSSRLPDKRRRDIKEILSKYNLDEYDSFELLKKSGGRLPTDSFEFVDPIILGENEVIKDFFIAGTRFHNLCDTTDCTKRADLTIGENLILKRQPDNKTDEYALEIYRATGQKLGYIPMVYSRTVTEAINDKRSVFLKIKEISSEKNCQECLKVELQIERKVIYKTAT